MFAVNKTIDLHPHPYRIADNRQHGMTLMEMMVVILLLGLVLAGGIPSFNALTHARLRKDATRLAGTIRYLYNQAALKGLCMRLTFDLKLNTYQVEASTDGRCLIDSEQLTAYQAKRKEEEEKRKEKQKKSTSTSTSTIGGWSGEKPISLELKKTMFQQINGSLLRKRGFAKEVTLDAVFVEHQKEAYRKDAGPRYAYLHCFPLGRCERAMIYLKDTRETVFSLEVIPLTGRVVIHSERVALTDRFTNQTKGDDDDS